jgi:2-polyprenyl-3-methyl-5-hydroxy-6-metoxy-1,4-benzoquinol methylase
MNDIYRENEESNGYNNLVVDVDRLYTEFPVDKMAELKAGDDKFTKSMFSRWYRTSLLPLKVKNYFWHAGRRTSLDQAWFEDFKDYWSYVLKGRPLWGPSDFYFLRGVYRIKFQRNEIVDTNDANVHLDAWQRPEIIYQLLHLVGKESFANEINVLNLLQQHSKRRVRSVLEFGCATAPITTSLFEFTTWSRDLKVYFADIKTLALHYAAFRFRKHANAIPVSLDARSDFRLSLSQAVDAIFCITVFEHLNKPLDTIEVLHKHLNKGGLLFFDYIKGDGGGLDTRHAIRERGDVIDFIKNNFVVLRGSLEKEKSMGLTVVKKR